MAVTFFKSKWEAEDLTLEGFLQRCVRDGYHGAVLGVAGHEGSPGEIREACARHGLRLMAFVYSAGKTPADHAETLLQQLAAVKEAGAESVNCHLGCDFFPFEENVGLFRKAMEWSEENGIGSFQETHRGRPLYNLPDTLRYLEACPGLQLTADISHFMCVHESDLSDRREWLDSIIPYCGHIHARIGFAEGPQVAHPMAPEWAGLRSIYLDFWRQVVQARNGDIVIMPEAGPPPYMPVVPFTRAPLADAWTVNTAVRDWLAEEL